MPTNPATEPSPTQAPFEPFSVGVADCSYGGAFKSIEALERHSVRFTLCAPEPAFLAKIAFPTFAIQPAEWLQQTGGGGQGSSLLVKPVGTGPYVVSEWRPGEQLIFTAFDGYWGEKARSQKLVFRWDREPAQRLLELQIGTVDGVDNLASTDFAAVQDDPGLELVLRAPLNICYLGMNNTAPPFDDERVRQAIAMALDRQRIVSEAFPAGYQAASYFTPCAIPNACVGEPWYAYDPARARDLLAQAGYPDGFRGELFYRHALRGYLPLPDLVAESIKTQLWDNLRIDLKIRDMDSQAFLEAIDSGEMQGLYLLGWGADYPDVTNFLDLHFGAGATEQFGHPFDDIISALAQGARLAGDESRRPFYEAANNAIREHVPMIPLAQGGWALPDSLAVGYKASAAGTHASPLNLETFSVMSIPGQDTFTWLQTAEPFSLYCADETDAESLRACAQVTEALYRYQVGGAAPEPGLAQICQPNDDLTVWTCTLRPGVIFHDGSALDAGDVALSWIVQWDAAHPLHKGNSGTFHYFCDFWGEFLNAP